MQHTFTVTTTKTVLLEVDDAYLTQEALEKFSTTIFPVQSALELMQHIADRVAQHGEHFVEGVGLASDYMNDKLPIKYQIEDDGSTVELIAV
jgi:hypothetical protein